MNVTYNGSLMLSTPAGIVILVGNALYAVA